jgi:hypothetical protein
MGRERLVGSRILPRYLHDDDSVIREGSRRARGVRLSLCSEDSSTASRLAWVLAKCPSSVQGGIALLGPCAIAKATSG